MYKRCVYIGKRSQQHSINKEDLKFKFRAIEGDTSGEESGYVLRGGGYRRVTLKWGLVGACRAVEGLYM